MAAEFCAERPRNRSASRATIMCNGNVELSTVYIDMQACLACHGEPKGEWDISGYPREGAHEGDLAGAISVRIPLDQK
jgi:hypothetical protein